jgi:methyl-accepting chemotaxis protein
MVFCFFKKTRLWRNHILDTIRETLNQVWEGVTSINITLRKIMSSIVELNQKLSDQAAAIAQLSADVDVLLAKPSVASQADLDALGAGLDGIAASVAALDAKVKAGLGA